MKSVNEAVSNALKRSYAIQARPRLVAEWNMNRYFDTTVDNIINEDENNYDNEIFPIESITEAFRPTKGIAKARIGEGTVYNFDQGTAVNRYYVADDDDVYKYWTSPVKTDNTTGLFPRTGSDSQVSPYVIYGRDLLVNKIVITVDNYWASPLSYQVKIQQSANGPWNPIATNPTINNDGTIVLYWNGTGWSSNKPDLVNPPLRTVRGVMIQVNSMTTGKDNNGNATRVLSSNGVEYTPSGRNAFFNLIEISARREVDLTDRLISVEDRQDMSEVSELYPIGTITSNTGSLTLSNLYTENGVQKTGFFSKSNAGSVYRNLLEPNVKFNLEYVYTIGGTDYPVQQFVLYGDEWQGLVSDEVNISLSDSSKFLGELYPQPMMFENLQVTEIIQRVLDSVGFVNWGHATTDDTPDLTIPVFWADGEKNVWEVLDDIAKGTQSAIYFDAWGKLWVKTRDAAYNSAKTNSWVIKGEAYNGELEDIIEDGLSQGNDLGANKITITYQTTKWDKWNAGNPAFTTVWQPEDTTVLRASQIARNIDNNSTHVYLNSSDIKIWPYEGIVQVDGELIKYKGKRFVYYTGPNAGTANVRNVATADEYKKFNQKTPSQFRSKNHFDGGLKIEERGYWNSEQRNHTINMQPYSVRSVQFGSSLITSGSAPGLTQVRTESVARLKNPGHFKGNDATVATIGSYADSPFVYYGARLKFVKENGLTSQRAGIAFNNQTNENGYYVELNASETPEIAFYSQKSNTLNKISSVEMGFTENVWYEVDIVAAGNDFTVWVDGVLRLKVNVPNAQQHSANGRFGMFVRGQTKADYEYIYGIARPEKVLDDDASYFNLIEGGYTGGFWDREWVYGWKTKKKRKKKKSKKQRYRWNNYFFDDFGPYAHEVREYDVKFDPAPVQGSRLYMTNEWQAICTEYRANAFGAHFVLANASRYNAVIHGDDTLTLGGNDRAIPQTLNVIGRRLVFADSQTVEVLDEDSIRIRGKVEAELSSQWIQNEDAANAVAEWMKKHWSAGLDTLEVELFGNPLLEIGDVVAMHYPSRHLNVNDHRYFITSVDTSWDNGITTKLSLRRAI